MTSARKVKVSLTLSADVLARADRVAAELDETRSGVIEAWLRRVIADEDVMRIEEETVAYYRSLTSAELNQDAALAKASSRAARRRKPQR